MPGLPRAQKLVPALAHAVLSRFLGLQQGFRHAEALPAARVTYRPLLLRVRQRLPVWRLLRPALEWLANPYRPAGEIIRAESAGSSEPQPTRAGEEGLETAGVKLLGFLRSY